MTSSTKCFTLALLAALASGCYGTGDPATSCEGEVEETASCGDLVIDDLDGCGLVEVSCGSAPSVELEMPTDWTCVDVVDSLGGVKGVLDLCEWKP